MKLKKCFVLYCDDAFYKFYEPLKKSIETYEPGSDLVLHLINSKLTGPGIINQTIDIKDKSQKPAYIICHKVKYFLETMKDNEEADVFIQLDIDMILNRPLDHIIGEFDVGGFRVADWKVAGGLLVAQPTDMAFKFLNEYNDELIKPNYFWDKDQPLLAKLYNKYSTTDLKWLHLDRAYLDPTNDPNSYIWSAHKSQFGSKDKRLAGFVKRMEKV